MSGSIFRARQSQSPTVSADSTTKPQLVLDNTLTDITRKSGCYELTKNKHYCVSRFPALPKVFKQLKSSDQLFSNAYSDHESNYSLVINEDSIYVWSYKSLDSSPLSIEFPIEKPQFELPLAILTKPSSGTGQDPGLVIIDSLSGLIKFYESVQHAPTLGLINDRSLEMNIPINTSKGEYITLAENVEPAGIAVATSWKRCILIQLRDYKSKPQLSTMELLSAPSSFLFLSKIFRSPSEDSNEIVCIRSGNISNHGTTQEIIIQDSIGNFYLFNYNLLSANVSPYVDKKRSFSQNLLGYVESSIEGFLPGANLNLKFLDIWPLLEYNNVYLALCHVDDPYRTQGKNLYLLTIKINPSGVLLYGCHKLTRFDPGSKLSSSPKLYLPQPGKTAFVIIDNSIIITDLNTSYIESRTTFVSYYKPRWEDMIRLKSSVEIIGSGYENQSSNSNPAIVLLTKNYGILRLEKFPQESYDEDSMETDETDISDPLLIVKSHIEQGIFYSHSQEIEFDLSQKFDESLILSAVDLIINELMTSTSAYMPKVLPTIGDLTRGKVNLFQELIEYSNRNFPLLTLKIIPKLVENLEKANTALNLWITIDADENRIKLKQILETVIKNSNIKIKGGDENILREFFSRRIDAINEILSSFIDEIIQQAVSTSFIDSLIVKTLYDGVYLNEMKYMANIQEFKAIKSWIFDTGLVIRVEEIFSEQFVKKQQQTLTVSQQTKENAHHIVQVLYYFITCAIKYMEKHEPSGKILKDYKHWYNGKETEWIKALLRLGLVNEALVLAEQYRAFGSLVVILESQREELSDTEEINQLYGKYFEMFGYSFASSVYSYYLKTGRIQPLLLDFMNYKHYLLEYFEKNPDKTANVSWIRSLLDQDFITASEALVRSANLKPKDKVLNREIKYSIAKLATIAASQSSEITDEKVSEIERQLEIVRYQKAVYNTLTGQIKLELLKLEEFRKSYVNHDLDNSLVNSVVEQYFQSFIEGIQLSPERLIDLLTTLKPSLLKKMGFANALRVAQSFQNESIADFYISVVWLRLLTIGEGEKLFMQWDNKNVSDEINKKKIVDSTLFNTLKEIKLESKLIERLDTLLVNPVVGDEHEDNITINQLNESLSSVLRKYLNNNQRNKNFKLWVEAVKEEVKLSL